MTSDTTPSFQSATDLPSAVGTEGGNNVCACLLLVLFIITLRFLAIEYTVEIYEH